MVVKQPFRRDKLPEVKKKQIIIATEGNKTEPAYFNYLNYKLGSELLIPIEREHRPAPPSVLEDLVEYIQQNKDELNESDEFWIVSDVNTWTNKHKEIVVDWCQSAEKKFSAASNP